jgi:hypothetical protein
MFLRNVGIYLPVHTASQPRRAYHFTDYLIPVCEYNRDSAEIMQFVSCGQFWRVTATAKKKKELPQFHSLRISFHIPHNRNTWYTRCAADAFRISGRRGSLTLFSKKLN